jgi:S1-C subfamily serine protease
MVLFVVGSAAEAQEPTRFRSPAMGLSWHDSAKGPVVIDAVEPQSTAARLGLEPGDIVVSVDDRPVAGSATLEQMLKRVEPGKKLAVMVRRGGKTVSQTALVPQSRVNMFGAALDADPRGKIVVAEVAPSTPAERAGLQPGDTVLSMAGQRHASLSDLSTFMAKLVAGDRADKAAEPIKLVIERKGEEEPLALVIEREPAPAPAATPIPVRELSAPPARQLALGIEVAEQGKQVVITRLLERGPAALAGMMPGDVIVAVGKRPVTSFADLVAIVANLKPGDQAAVDVARGNKTGVLEVQVVQGKPGSEDVVLAANNAPAADGVPARTDPAAPMTLEQEVRDLRARVEMLEQIVAKLVRERAAERR